MAQRYLSSVFNLVQVCLPRGRVETLTHLGEAPPPPPLSLSPHASPLKAGAWYLGTRSPSIYFYNDIRFARMPQDKIMWVMLSVSQCLKLHP